MYCQRSGNDNVFEPHQEFTTGFSGCGKKKKKKHQILMCNNSNEPYKQTSRAY